MNKDIFIAVDFDGTCVKHRFPDIGEDVPNCVDVLKDLHTAGYKLILNTMRSDGKKGNFLSNAVKWFNDRGIELYGVNCNPTQKAWTSSPKVYAHIYIDDAALGAPLIKESNQRVYIDWIKVSEWLLPPPIKP
jgi:hypothetical protein